MSDETVSACDATVPDSTVSLPADKFQTILATVRNQEIKLKAMKNLSHIIQSKDQELKASQEKAENLQAALDKAEMRLANQIRLTAVGCPSRLDADPAMQSSSFKSNSFSCKSSSLSNALRSETTLSSKPYSQPYSETVDVTSSDLEADSAELLEPISECQMRDTFSSLNVSSPSASVSLLSKSMVAEPKSSFTKPCPSEPVSLQSRGVKSSVPSFLSIRKEDTFTVLDSTEKVFFGNESIKSIGAVGVSRDLLDKLMQQNTRLKKVIRDILNQQGLSMEKYLDKQEMQDVVEQLREELRRSKAQNERLKEIINGKDSDDLSKKYSELSENFQKLKRTSILMQAMADSYSKEYEKLKLENKELREQQSAAKINPRTSGHWEQNQSNEEMASMSLKAQLAETLEELNATRSKCDALQQHCQQQLDKLTSNENEFRKAEEAFQKQIETLEADKDLLQNQISVFQDDFIAERKENAQRQQQLESTIVKHQDWIRKLATEAQKSRILFEEEKTKREKAEAILHEVEARLHSSAMQNRRAGLNCGLSESLQFRHTPHADLQVDYASEPASAPCHLQSSEEAECEDQNSPLVCPRCEREFDIEDKQRWKDHCARCTDD